MFQRRLIYTMTLLASLVFFWAYRKWLSGLLLTAVMLTPVFSFLVSLPAILSCKVRLQYPNRLQIGSEASVSVDTRCRFPIPMYRVKLRFSHSYSRKSWKSAPGQVIPTDHCGALAIRATRTWMYDYLGLIRLPVVSRQKQTIVIRPVPVKPEKVPDVERFWCSATRPKPGGGYAENHELRLYRPGDNLRQIHWKLSAKTGTLIIREPMEAIKGAAILTLELRGSLLQLNSKLGRLLWMSNHLLEKEIPHRICCLTGSGMSVQEVTDEQQLEQAIDNLLLSPLAAPDAPAVYPKSLWRFHIGGDGNE